MRIDYCPKCHKAGLKYEHPIGHLYRDLHEDGAVYGEMKWCPRCREWIKPEASEWRRP